MTSKILPLKEAAPFAAATDASAREGGRNDINRIGDPTGKTADVVSTRGIAVVRRVDDAARKRAADAGDGSTGLPGE